MKLSTAIKLSTIGIWGCAIGLTINAILMVVFGKLVGNRQFIENGFWFALGFGINYLNLYFLTKKDNK